MTHYCIFYCVSLISDIASFLVCNTAGENCIIVTILVCLVLSHFQKMKCRIRVGFLLVDCGHAFTCWWSPCVLYTASVSYKLTSPAWKYKHNIHFDRAVCYTHIDFTYMIQTSLYRQILHIPVAPILQHTCTEQHITHQHHSYDNTIIHLDQVICHTHTIYNIPNTPASLIWGCEPTLGPNNISHTPASLIW